MQGSLERLVIMSGLGGASNAAILAAINSGAQAAGNGQVSIFAAALFIIAVLLFIKTQHYILIAATVEIEAIIHRLRVRLMDQVRHSELLPLDSIGRAEIVAAIKLLAETEGIFTETAGGVTTGVTQKLIAQGRIQPQETTVVSITGNGFFSFVFQVPQNDPFLGTRRLRWREIVQVFLCW